MAHASVGDGPPRGPPVPQSLACIPLHLIFSTKHREPSIAPAWADRLYEYAGGVARDHGCRLLAAGGVPDHVHLLVSLGREMAVADLLRVVKAGTSRWVRETFHDAGGFAWQTGYGAFAVSFSQLGAVRQYIATQADRHRTVSFQDELRRFLRKHEVAFDERYVWD